MESLELRAGREIVRIKTLMRLRKNSPTVSAVHVDSVMGSKKKKKKKKIVFDDIDKSLTQWFEEKWVDISRPKKGGGFEPCGRSDAESGKYPKCVPASKASRMSAEEISSAVQRKRKAESTQTRVDKKPINVSTKVKKASKNVPTNPELYARVKAEAKQKFDVYPSAYANAWLVREYKSRGGKYKVTKADSPAWQRSAGKNPKGGLNAKGRASYKRETGGTLKPPVKAGDNPRRASFLARMGNMAGPERDENGEPTRLLLSLQAWGAKSKADARKKAKAISARNEVQKFNPNHDELGRFDSGAGTGYDSGMTTNFDSGLTDKGLAAIGRATRSALKQAIQSGELPADLDITVKSVPKDIQRSRTSRGKRVSVWTQRKRGLLIRVPEKQYYDMTENQRSLISKIAKKHQERTKIYDTQGEFSSTVDSYAVDFFYDTGGDYD